MAMHATGGQGTTEQVRDRPIFSPQNLGLITDHRLPFHRSINHSPAARIITIIRITTSRNRLAPMPRQPPLPIP